MERSIYRKGDFINECQSKPLPKILHRKLRELGNEKAQFSFFCQYVARKMLGMAGPTVKNQAQGDLSGYLKSQKIIPRENEYV